MSYRTTVVCEEADAATEIKEKFFKQLYEHKGTTVVFETPEDDDMAKAIAAAAKEAGHEVSGETYEDPLDDAEAVDFW